MKNESQLSPTIFLTEFHPCMTNEIWSDSNQVTREWQEKCNEKRIRGPARGVSPVLGIRTNSRP